MSSVLLYTKPHLALHAAVNIVKTKSQDLAQRVSSCANVFIAHIKQSYANLKQSCHEIYTSFNNANFQKLKQFTAILLTTAGALGALASIASLNIPHLILSGSALYLGLNLFNQ